MAWNDTKEPCSDPPNCAGNQKITAAEWNAMVAVISTYLRMYPVDAPGPGDDGKFLQFDYTNQKWVLATGAGGSTTFDGLTDTPANKTGSALKYVRVNSGATALEYADAAGGGDMLKSVYDPDEDGLIAAAQTETDIFISSGARAMTGSINVGTYGVKFGTNWLKEETGYMAIRDLADTQYTRLLLDRIFVNNDLSLQRLGDTNELWLYAGESTNQAAIGLFGRTHATYPGRIEFDSINAAKTSWLMAAYIEGTTDTPRFVSQYGVKVDVVTGTAPLVVASTTNVTNLNADMVDGKHLADLLEVADGDFNAFTEKGTPVSADILLLEDSAASYAKKKVQAGNLVIAHGADKHTNVTRKVFFDAHSGYTTGEKVSYGNYPIIALDKATDEYVNVTFRIPYDYASGGILKFVFVNSMTLTGNIVWEAALNHAADGEVFTGNASSDLANVLAVASDSKIKEVTTTLAFTSLSKEDYVGVQFARDADNASDTLDQDFAFLGWIFEYTAEQ